MIESYENLCELIRMNEKILNSCNHAKQKISDELHRYRRSELSGGSCGTSYLDADCIHKQGKVELRYDILEDLIRENQQYDSMAYLQNEILVNLYKTKSEIDEKLRTLKGIEYKVFYNRVVKGLTQEQTAEVVKKSDRQVRRIERRYKNI